MLREEGENIKGNPWISESHNWLCGGSGDSEREEGVGNEFGFKLVMNSD